MRFTYVVHKLLHHLPPQTDQDHVMVRVVLRVPDGHVLEQYAICYEDIIRPGTDLSSIPMHDTRCWEKSINIKSINGLLLNAKRAYYGTSRKNCFI